VTPLSSPVLSLSLLFLFPFPINNEETVGEIIKIDFESVKEILSVPSGALSVNFFIHNRMERESRRKNDVVSSQPFLRAVSPFLSFSYEIASYVSPVRFHFFVSFLSYVYTFIIF